MPSPFPGMNPYLEQETVWHDFHERFIPLAAELIGAQVLPRSFVKINEHIYVHELGEDRPRLAGRGDVLVAKGKPQVSGGIGAQLLEAPARVRQPEVDVERQSFLEIRDRTDRHLVAVLELLSPSNKYRGPDRDQYLAKCRQLLSSTVHLVEIDLLRGGPRLPWIDLPECDYCAVVSRVEQRPEADLWPIRLRDPLPPLPIPLKEGDPDAFLDLQQALHHIYDKAGYHYYIYSGSPQPSLREEDEKWAAELLSRAGVSKTSS
jgi:hypothetical protein